MPCGLGSLRWCGPRKRGVKRSSEEFNTTRYGVPLDLRHIGLVGAFQEQLTGAECQIQHGVRKASSIGFLWVAASESGW